MADPSGDGWAKHMLHGTSRLLQGAGATTTISRPRKAFLGIFRMFEANRAILYGEGTILSSLEWAPTYQMDDQTPVSKWDSLGRIPSIMAEISTFNTRYASETATDSLFYSCPPSDSTDMFQAL